MDLQTILLIMLAAALSLGLVVYQYWKEYKKNRSPYIYLMVARFLAVFAILLLLINPRFVKEQYYLEKSNLVLLVDNSSSIAHARAEGEAMRIVEEIEANGPLNEKFELRRLSFHRELSTSDSLLFDRATTNIQGALTAVRRTYKGKSAAFVILTDGNQTVGSDYQYFKSDTNHSVFPVVLGDTTRYEDMLIDRLNVNKYAFLDNQYPLEIFLKYQGTNSVQVPLTIKVNGILRHREMVQMSGQQNSVRVNVLLRAESVGMKRLTVEAGRLENERNIANNSQEAGLEVIDEKTKVSIVSALEHPDLGALKKAIESNNQRKAETVRPTVDLDEFEDTDIFIFYQPVRQFAPVYELVKNKRGNLLTITGPETDWNFLNSVQSSFQKNSFNQTEEVTPVLNAGFGTFDISGFNTENFPPLQTTLGDLLMTKPYQTLIEQRIKGVDLNLPLMALVEDGPGKEVVLFGENIWKWRVQNYRNNNDFDAFDELMAKLLLYLSSDNARDRLNLEYERIYRDASSAQLRASYFDETFEIDRNANITLFISGRNGELSRQIPMLFRGSFYEADLSSLPAGSFDFTVRIEGEEIMKSGQFSILEFDLEQQLISSDGDKLKRLASTTGGESYFPGQSNDLIAELSASDRYRPTQKSEQNVVSLIDFKILLAIVITAFASEWFIRKYNGLI